MLWDGWSSISKSCGGCLSKWVWLSSLSPFVRLSLLPLPLVPLDCSPGSPCVQFPFGMTMRLGGTCSAGLGRSGYRATTTRLGAFCLFDRLVSLICLVVGLGGR
ncbi:hypothetical protein DFP72DRAFT_896043 [Ephemerocybe angulata]|uniref:Secreted protein n=1 Tax=Ephemerocybe angulata TaxID=980116 RepID=A0A8H6HZ17_9AGAR|nr:hypothetical protein DFP72DRAFT_911596 [Tulosesus angulatus]KAF6755539.1 hypothetical protein DFP72DRAFT_896000 [Tulosesus angulatus]KAF6755561.1 hypothetical protein DFP72DRAFT_896043 [Tulosesus angulatus]